MCARLPNSKCVYLPIWSFMAALSMALDGSAERRNARLTQLGRVRTGGPNRENRAVENSKSESFLSLSHSFMMDD